MFPAWSASCLQIAMASAEASSETTFTIDLEGLAKKKGYNWTREETLLLISLYQEKKDLFQNVNYKKKQIWEMIASKMSEHGCTARPEQCEGKWKALTLAFRKCEDHNNQSGNSRRECSFYKELADVYGYRPNVRPVATSSSSGLGDSQRAPSTSSNNQLNKRSTEGTEERMPKKKTKRTSTGRETEHWFKEFMAERRQENERRLERLERQHEEKMGLLSQLLDVLKNTH